MNESKLITLNIKDFVKSLLVAVISAVLSFAYTAIQAGTLFPINWEQIGTISLGAMLAYLLKNLSTNSDGKVLKKEAK
ncbi:MAG: hypothetical protein GY861_29355 [bacterium]|nr:hypothetical protein [bacterium]